MQTTDAAEKATFIRALFSMPESAAFSSWQTRIEEPKLDGLALSEITAALADQLTIKSAHLPAEIIWSTAQPSSALDQAIRGVHPDEMCDAGNPALKKHIESLTRQHGTGGAKYKLE